MFIAAGGDIERAGRASRPELARDRATRRRHRQDAARSAVERLLRQGARRPLLALVRARPLRQRYELEGIDYPPATSAGPSAATSACFIDLRRRRALPIDADRAGCSRSTTRPTSMARIADDELKGIGFLFEYPLNGARRPVTMALAAVAGAGAPPRRRRPRAGCASASSVPATTRPRCCCPISSGDRGRAGEVATATSLSADERARQVRLQARLDR